VLNSKPIGGVDCLVMDGSWLHQAMAPSCRINSFVKKLPSLSLLLQFSPLTLRLDLTLVRPRLHCFTRFLFMLNPLGFGSLPIGLTPLWTGDSQCQQLSSKPQKTAVYQRCSFWKVHSGLNT